MIKSKIWPLDIIQIQVKVTKTVHGAHLHLAYKPYFIRAILS